MIGYYTCFANSCHWRRYPLNFIYRYNDCFCLHLAAFYDFTHSGRIRKNTNFFTRRISRPGSKESANVLADHFPPDTSRYFYRVDLHFFPYFRRLHNSRNHWLIQIFHWASCLDASGNRWKYPFSGCISSCSNYYYYEYLFIHC